MSALLPTLKIDSEPHLAKHFTSYQVHWILAEDALHAQGKQVYALAEKSIRIGWTFCDGFKNVRKRLRFKKRDYLFATGGPSRSPFAPDCVLDIATASVLEDAI